MAEDLKKPVLSVVMSVYNDAEYVGAAIDSILSQTLQDFEFLIINDGSTDDTEKAIKSYKDPRIKLIIQPNNGLVASLNIGIQTAQSEYIARQDADDLSDPERLKKQLAVLENDPSVAVVGSSMKVMDESGGIMHEHRVLLNDAELKQELLVRSPFAHGSVIFRKTAFEKAGGYHQQEWPAEDYGLWLRMAPYGKFANLDEPLYTYRESGFGISGNNLHDQNSKMAQTQNLAWRNRKDLLGRPITTTAYASLPMGQFRVERIVHNLLFSMRRSATGLNLFTFGRMASRLLADGGLRRKCARLVLVKLGLKRG